MNQEIIDTLYKGFIGRKQYVAEIENFLMQKNNDHLHFYGIGGIGKSSLKKMIQRNLYENKEYIYLHLDFEFKQYQNISQALLSLRSSVLKRYKFARFPSFDIAYSYYWKKLNPLVKIKEDSILPFLEEGDVSATIYDEVKQDPFIGVFPKIANIGYKFYNKTKDWLDQRNFQDLKQLNELEAEEVELFLPKFWIEDFFQIISSKDVHCVLILDTLEKIGKLKQGNFLMDESFQWVKLFIQSFSNTSIISFGREKFENIKQRNLKEFEVLPFDYDETYELLKNHFIGNKEISEELFKSTRGIPYYLDLAIKTYNRIGLSRTPDKKDFEGNLEKVIERFVKYLNEEERAILEVLSVPKGWDEKLYDTLFLKEDDLLKKRVSFIEGCNFVTYNEDLKQFTMHELMREYLLKNLKQNVKRYNQINQKVYHYYKNILLELHYSTNPSLYEYILGETFYHAKELSNQDDFISIISNVCRHTVSRSKTYNLLIKEIYEFSKSQNVEIGFLYNLSLTLLTYYIYYSNAEQATLYINETRDAYNKIDEENRSSKIIFHLFVQLMYFKMIKDYRQAEKTILELLNILEVCEDGEATQSLKSSCHGHLATIYKQLNEFEKAAHYSDLSLKYVDEEMTKEYAMSLGNRGTTDLDNLQFTEALEKINHALTIFEELGMYRDIDYFILKAYQAEALIGLGKFEEGVEIHKEVLKQRVEFLSENHVDVAESYMYLVDQYMKDKQKYKLVKDYLKKSIEILSKLHPSRDLAVAYSRFNVLELENGNESDAIMYAEKSLKIMMEVSDNIEIAFAYDNLGKTFDYFGRYQEALECFNKGIDILNEQQEPLMVERYIKLLKGKGEVLRKLMKFDEAKVIYQKMLPFLQVDSLELADIYNLMGTTLQNLSDYYAAERNYKKALKIRLNHLPKNHRDVGVTYMNLGHIYTILKAKNKAKDHLEKAISIFNGNTTENRNELYQVCMLFVNLHMNLRDSEKGKYYFELAKLYK